MFTRAGRGRLFTNCRTNTLPTGRLGDRATTKQHHILNSAIWENNYYQKITTTKKTQESNTIIVLTAPIQLAALCGPHTPHTPRYATGATSLRPSVGCDCVLETASQYAELAEH